MHIPTMMTERFDNRKMLPFVLPVCLLAAWFVATENEMIPPYLLPPPQKIVATAYTYIFGTPGEGAYAGRFLADAAASTARIAFGFGIAACLGIPLGILSGRLAAVQKLLGASINALRAVPGISLLPLALVWFGIGLKTTVFLVGLAAFFPIYLNAAGGARQVDIVWYHAGAMMGIGRVRGVTAILLPAAMPYIMAGLRLGLGISWAYLVLGELTGVPNGLGAVIMDARLLGRIDMIIVGIIIIAVFGRISDLMLMAGLRLVSRSARRMK